MSNLSPLPIVPPPGVVLTESERVVEGRYIASRNIRFVKQRPQKVGGWVKAFATPTDGTPRTLHAWRDNTFNQYLAAGTYKKLYVYDTELTQNDITPFRDTGTLTNPFTTTNGSATVAVTDVNHGVNAGDIIHFSGSSAVGGITPNGDFTVVSVIDADHYSFVFTSNATSGATGGGTVTYQYEIHVGVEVGAFGYGYGIGPYGIGTYGTARTVSTVGIEPRVWSLDHFGQLLLGAFNISTIYKFDPTQARPWGRAVVVDATAPTNVRAMFITPERFVMALLDNMQVQWNSQGDLATWIPAVGNTANIRTLTEGTKLVSGRVLADFVSLIWTDAALYRFQYSGSLYVYNSSMVAKDCGLIAPGAAVTAGGIAYWMGPDTFWTYNGAVSPMANVEDIRKFVYDRLRTDYAYQCSAIFNPKYQEVWFFWTVVGADNPTLGAIFSIENQCWAPLDWGRAGGTHFTQGDTRPYMGAPDFFIYRHEDGNDANGVSLPWSLTLSPYAMSEGQTHMDMEYFVPDYFEQVGNITMTVTGWDRLNDSASEDSETEVIPPVDSGTIDMRVSGRYLGLVQSCDSLGSYVRMGKPVAFIKPSGDRS